MIIFTFRGKTIVLDPILIGLSAYTVTVCLLWFLKRKEEERKSLHFFRANKRRLFSIRGGDSKTKQFLRDNVKTDAVYEVTNAKLAEFIRKTCKTSSIKETLVVDTSTLAYALRNYEKFEITDLKGRKIFKILKPFQLLSSIIIGTCSAFIAVLRFGAPYAIGVSLVGWTYYVSPLNHYSADYLDECIKTDDNMSIVLTDPNHAPVIVSRDTDVSKIMEYIPKKTFVSDSVSKIVKEAKRIEKKEAANEEEKDLLVVEKHKTKKVTREYKPARKRKAKVVKYSDFIKELQHDEALDVEDVEEYSNNILYKTPGIKCTNGNQNFKRN